MWAKSWAGTAIYWCGKFNDSSYSEQEKDRELGTGEQPLVYIPLEEKEGFLCRDASWGDGNQHLMTPSSQLWSCCTPGSSTPASTPPAPSSLRDPTHSAPTPAPHTACCLPCGMLGWARPTSLEVHLQNFLLVSGFNYVNIEYWFGQAKKKQDVSKKKKKRRLNHSSPRKG